MKQVKLLDCTLRDGGYINDWEFGYSTMRSIYKRLDDSGVNYIEIGFLDDRREYDPNRSIQPNVECYNKIYDGIKKKNAIPVAMIDYGTCDISNIPDAKDNFVEGIRVIFKKEKIDQALPFCEKIKEKGYLLFIQAISITAYSDIDLLEYIQLINKVNPYAFSIVDTYGLLDNRKMAHYFELLDNNLLPDICIGYHDHNNFQLAFSNTMEFMEMKTKRTIIGDASVYGMGKSAGNCNIELLAMYMNDSFGTSYDINQYLEIFDTDLSLIYQKYYWGYKYDYYIAAMQNCHPLYVQRLLEKKTLTITDINKILASIPEEKKLIFDVKYIDDAYSDFLVKIDGKAKNISSLKKIIKDNTILLLGPGKTISKQKEDIIKFVDNKSPLIISVNYIPDGFDPDFIFLNNSKRYTELINSNHSNSEIVLTSNISDYENVAKYTLNYSSLVRSDIEKKDNALLLLLCFLIQCEIDEVFLAGFDGYSLNGDDYDSTYHRFVLDGKEAKKNNEAIKKSLKKLDEEIVIRFITETCYK